MFKIILILLSLTSCAVFDGGLQRASNLRNLTGIHIGMSQTQVENTFGSPTSINYGAYSRMWVYRNYRGRILGTQTTYVYFDRSGRVANWSGSR